MSPELSGEASTAGRNLLIIGHSHVGPIRQAAIIRREADPDRPRARTIHLLDPAFAPEMDGNDFSSGVKRVILDQIERHHPIVASVMGGNAHSAYVLIPRERFDFRIEGGETLPIDDSVPIRSEEEMRAILADILQPEVQRLRLLHALIGPFWQLESPPPVRRADWIIAHAESYFIDQPDFHSLGVAPAGVRYRTWLLASRMIREACEQLGCSYLEVPRRLRGEAGLLRPSHARDATHGNHYFGEAMLQALEAAAV
ncbi:hypothetical protein [Rhizorhabdus argentea]|uniref:hypothetical protein n=1 Tax=Rhizorhabdus argentea TaxID=1387174 RepID=UPI0030EE38F0